MPAPLGTCELNQLTHCEHPSLKRRRGVVRTNLYRPEPLFVRTFQNVGRSCLMAVQHVFDGAVTWLAQRMIFYQRAQRTKADSLGT